MNAERPSILSFAAILVAVIVLSAALAACGDDDSSDSSAVTDTTPTTEVSGNTVDVQPIEGVGEVLVDSSGSALYTNDQDRGAKVACTGECTSIWPPLTVDPGTQPASDDSTVEAKLDVITRPDGPDQVTFAGKPLYAFADDSPGQAGGDGVQDVFGGVSFTWAVATAGSSSRESIGGETATGDGTDTGSGSSSGGESSGAYGY